MIRQKRGHGEITVAAAEFHAESAFEMIKQDCEGYVLLRSPVLSFQKRFRHGILRRRQ
jgi:hypothetical protein